MNNFIIYKNQNGHKFWYAIQVRLVLIIFAQASGNTDTVGWRMMKTLSLESLTVDITLPKSIRRETILYFYIDSLHELISTRS